MLLILASHPIQYQTPIFRSLARQFPDALHVVFKNLDMGNGALDPDFGIPVRWDTPILEGYQFSALNEEPRGVRALLAAKRPTAVLLTLGYTDPLALEAIFAARSLGIPVLWRFEGNDRNSLGSGFKAFVRAEALSALYRHISVFLSIGVACDEHLARHGVPASKVFRSPYNVDDELFQAMRHSYSAQRDTIRSSKGLSEDDFVFIVVGKLIERKNPHIVLRALRRIGDAKVKVVFVGSGPLEIELKQAASCLGNRAIFGGFANQTDLGRFYACADAALLPSRFETWGLVINEAQHFALPVVVSDKVGCRDDLVKNCETGWVFREGDVEDLAKKLSLMSSDRRLASRMGCAGELLARSYSTSAAAAGIVAAFNHVTGGAHERTPWAAHRSC